MSDLDLFVAADAARHSGEFRLLDQHGAQLAYRHTDFSAIPLSLQRGLFDLRNYLRNYVKADRQPAAVAEIGACIANDVLGDEMFEILWRPQTPRSDVTQAIAQGRVALALFNTLPDPDDRFSSHDELAQSLKRSGEAAERTEATRHKLAGLVYVLEAKLGLGQKTALESQSLDFKNDPPADATKVLPPLAEVLADPAFAPLKQWLLERKTDPRDLQSEILAFLRLAQRQASQA